MIKYAINPNDMIYFVRHGESEANKKGVFAGQRDDSPLTDIGREQAKDTALNLKDQKIKFDRIVTSPLIRTSETATIIAKELNFEKADIYTDSRLTEYDMGDLTGSPLRKITSQELVSATGAEDPESFRNRVYSCFKELVEYKSNIIVVSSAGVGRILETIKANSEPSLFYDIPAYKNASVTIIDWIV